MLATVSDLEARLGADITGGAAIARAEAALEDASAIVLDEGDDEWTDQTVPARAKQVVLAAALRVWRNPDGLSQSSVGDVSVSYSRSGAQGAAYLTKHERRAVRRLAGRSFEAATYESPYPPRVGHWFAGGSQ